MSVLEDLSEDECYLLAILDDQSGLDQAEMMWVDETQDDGIFRAWPFQVPWWRCRDERQIDQCGRSVGKTLGVKMRLWSFPLRRPGHEALVTGPELVHLRPVTDLIETQLLDTRLTREMLRVNKGGGSFTHQPFAVRFKNGARIMGRLPQKTGRGVKGQHPSELEMDEAQDYPKPGWTELFATLKKGAGASWRSHGVTRGVQDEFYRFSQPGSGWTVHQITAMHRPTWTDAERQMEVSNYGGGKDDPDYRRNVMGFHGDATNMLFVTSRLMKCVDDDRSSEFNQEEFTHVELTAEQVDALGDGGDPRQMLQFPDRHRNDYTIFWAGMDVGYTADPSEILVFAEYHLSDQERAAMVARKKAHPMEGVSRLKLVTRITLKRFSAPDQMMVLIGLDEFYNLQGLGIDKMQPVSEPVLTPAGWKPIGNVRVGDEVIGSDGRPTAVTGVYPQQDRRVLRLTCSDGSWTRCGPEHLWTVRNSKTAEERVVTTEQLGDLISRPGQRQWTIPMMSGPALFADQEELPVDPYLLGLLIGDGNLRRYGVRFSSVDEEVIAEVESRLPAGTVLKHTDRCNYIIRAASKSRNADGRFTGGNPLLGALRGLGLAGKLSHEKFVPWQYMTATPAARLELLRGIMDSDGYVSPNQKVRPSCTIGIRSSSERLVQDVIELVESLGGSGRYAAHATSCNGVPGRTAYRASICMPREVVPFKLSRKRDAVVPRQLPVQRFVRTIEPDGEEESVCIRVAAADELYITRHHLVTHNTGNGLPLYQFIQKVVRGQTPWINPELVEAAQRLASKIKGYNFSAKEIVDLDDQVEVDELDGDPVKDTAMRKLALEQATDVLREYVDHERLWLPWEQDTQQSVIKEFGGQTFSYSRSAIDQHGRPRRVFSTGKFHALDGARMFAMAHSQAGIEAIVNAKPVQESVVVIGGGGW